ncbi:hypothetical protein [Saccharothrix sp. HUAS TT1]|uniref:hypothetical protein n=1 Tax=unclassified Saccharothrix TaxID=2593673 RepID=UPI00345BD63E
MIRDRWYTTADNGVPTATPQHGHGCRWEAGYRDRPRGPWRRRRFERLPHARIFAADMDAVRRADLAALPGSA